jgi:hypothetical protein
MTVDGLRGTLSLPTSFRGLPPMVETKHHQRHRIGQQDPLRPARGLLLGLGLAVIFWSLIALLIFAYRQI